MWNPRIFGSRFIDDTKRAGDGLCRENRLVAQNYSDEGASLFETKAPTVQRWSQEKELIIEASKEGMIAYTREVTQASVKSRTTLEGPVYIKPPLEIGLDAGTVWRAVKPMYGIPETALNWYLTYISHNIDTLGMRRSRCDPCVLIKNGWWKWGFDSVTSLRHRWNGHAIITKSRVTGIKVV